MPVEHTARARDINGGHTAFNKTPCDINGNAKPDFFDDDGNGKRGNERRNGGSNTTPIAITALLNGFLDGIEMQNEGIRFDLIDRAARIVNESTEHGGLYHMEDMARMKRAFEDKNIAKERADVERALERLEDGSYFTDEITGAALSDDVLASRPTARHA